MMCTVFGFFSPFTIRRTADASPLRDRNTAETRGLGRRVSDVHCDRFREKIRRQTSALGRRHRRRRRRRPVRPQELGRTLPAGHGPGHLRPGALAQLLANVPARVQQQVHVHARLDAHAVQHVHQVLGGHVPGGAPGVRTPAQAGHGRVEHGHAHLEHNGRGGLRNGALHRIDHRFLTRAITPPCERLRLSGGGAVEDLGKLYIAH